MVSFTGRCLVHRAEILQLRGAWPAALDEARMAERRFGQVMHEVAAGEASYRKGEIHRLRGERAAAARAYRDARRRGREPQPGLCLLRLAEGDTDAAAAAIRRAVGETTGVWSARHSFPPTSRSCWRWAPSTAPAQPAASSSRSPTVSGAGCSLRRSRRQRGPSPSSKGTAGPSSRPCVRRVARGRRSMFRSKLRVSACLLGSHAAHSTTTTPRRWNWRPPETCSHSWGLSRTSLASTRSPRASTLAAPWALAARAGGVALGCRRRDEQGDRRVALPQRANGRASPQQHFLQAPRTFARGRHRVCV